MLDPLADDVQRVSESTVSVRDSEARGVSGDAVWSLTYLCLVRAGTLAVSVAVARLSGTEAAGAFGVALQITALGTMFASFNIPQSLARHLAATEDPRRQRDLIRTSGRMVGGLAIVIGAAVMVASQWLALHVYRDAALATILLSCGPLIIATVGYVWVEGALQGIRRFASLARWGAIVTLADLTLGVLSAHWGAAAIVLCRSAIRTGAVVAALRKWFADRRDGVPARPEPERLVSTTQETLASAELLLGFAGPALLAAGVVLVGQTLLRLMLVRASGLQSAGYFQAADSIAQVLFLMPGAVSMALMRAVASDSTDEGKRLGTSVKRSLEAVVGLNTAASLVLIGLSGWAVTTVFGGRFAQAGPSLAFLAAGYGLMGPSGILGAVMLGRGEVWTGFVVNVLWVITILAADSVVTSMGAEGAALAVAVGYLVLLIAAIAFVVPHWNIQRRLLVPPIAASTSAIAISLTLRFMPGVSSGWGLGISAAMATLIFFRWGVSTLRHPWTKTL